MSIVKRIAEFIQGLPARSPRWPAVRKQWLKWNPTCAACGSTTKLEVHHIVPFHLDRSRELEAANLVTLCENGGNCHLMFGHLKHWRSHNEAVRQDAAAFLDKVKKRPGQ